MPELEIVEGGDDQPQKGPDSPMPQMFEITVNGKKEKFDLSSPEQRETLRQRAQMGTNYSQKVEALNVQEIERQKTYRPYVEFDRIVKGDPDLEAIVVAKLRGDPLPLERFGVRPAARKAADDENGDGDRPNLDAIKNELRQESNAKTDRVVSALERMEKRMDWRDQRDAEHADELRIKSHPVFKGWVKDDHMTLAKEAMRQRGGGLYENFVLLFEHEIPKIVSGRDRESIPPEMRRTLLSRDTAPLVVEGQTLSEEKLAEIRNDPDLYAKYKKALRAHKRSSRGLLEYPR